MGAPSARPHRPVGTRFADVDRHHRGHARDQPRRPRRRGQRRRLRPRPHPRRRPRLVQARGVLRGARPRVQRLQPRRHGRPARADGEAGLPAVAGRRLPVAAAVLRLPAARRRLRHPRLPHGAAGVRHGRRLRHAARRGPQARHPRDHRPRHEPHLRHPPVVRGVAPPPRRPLRRLLHVGGRRLPLPGGAHHLRRHRAVQLDLRPGARPVLLAPLLLPPARPQLRLPGRAGGDARRPAVLAGPRHRRVPAGRRALPLRPRRHELREPPRDPRVPQALPEGAWRTSTRAG